MGVIYKLKTEVKDFILKTKNTKPELSCRGLATIVENQFQVKVSKSSINAIIKEAGLSLPVGRRLKKKIRTTGALTIQLQTPIKALVEKVAESITSLSLLPQIEKPVAAPAETPVEALAPPPVTEESAVPPAIAPTPEKPVEAPKEEVAAEKITSESVQPPIEEKPVEKPAEEILQQPVIKEVTIVKPTQIELPIEALGLGAILLKAADYLVGGSLAITQTIKNRLKSQKPDLLAKTESLIYASLFDIFNNSSLSPDSGLWALINQRLTKEEILSYLSELEQVKVLNTDLLRTISTIFQEIRGIQVGLFDGSVFYLDGQLYTVWSAPQIPYDFSTTIYNVKSYINKYFENEEPCSLFAAPGYDIPSREFFDFILGLGVEAKRVNKLILYDNKFEELEIIRLETQRKHFFVIGAWPWQFGQYRKLNILNEFQAFHFEPLNKDFYIAEAKIELLQPNINKAVTLRALLLKLKPTEKTKLLILSNLSPERASLQELAKIYLSRWPNLEEAFDDFSRKIELFTYTANAHRFFSIDQLNSSGEESDITGLFNYYLRALDLYVRWHFLPSGYEDKDFSTVKEHFYDQKVFLEKQKEYIRATFKPAPDYPYLKDLAYACRRLNEREIRFSDGLRLWFIV